MWATRATSTGISSPCSPLGECFRSCSRTYAWIRHSHSLVSTGSYGLSYTTFKYGKVTASKPTGKSAADFSVEISLSVTNSGPVVGSEVAQVYVSLPKGHLTHPLQQLRAFKKVKDITPGETEDVKLTLDKYAVSYWDDVINRWRADKGVYTVRVGGSSDKTEEETTFEVEKAFEWTGL